MMLAGVTWYWNIDEVTTTEQQEIDADSAALQVVVEQGQVRFAVDQERVGLARMIEVMDNGCQQRPHFVHLVENNLRVVIR